jgi:hypothetical protein
MPPVKASAESSGLQLLHNNCKSRQYLLSGLDDHYLLTLSKQAHRLTQTSAEKDTQCCTSLSLAVQAKCTTLTISARGGTCITINEPSSALQALTAPPHLSTGPPHPCHDFVRV